MRSEPRGWSWFVLGVVTLVSCKVDDAADGGNSATSKAGAEVSVPSNDGAGARVTSSSSGTGTMAMASPGVKAGAAKGTGTQPIGGVGGTSSIGDGASDDGGVDSPLAPEVATRLSSPDWSSYGHDMSNTRHNPGETRISVDNIAQLQLKWSWNTAAVTSTAAYRDGTLYFGDWQGAVVALDATSGKQLWRTLDPDLVIGMITTSPFIEQGALYIGGNTANWYRINSGTGAIEWKTVASDGGSANTLSSLGRIGSLVIAGMASFQNVNPIDGAIGAAPFRGSVVALDSSTGKKVWEFFTTTGTGTGVSSSAAFDPERKRLFIGTGQNYDTMTDSPYADSLLALDYETGEYAWHAQYTQGDAWSLSNMDDGDLDVLSTPVLYTAGGVDMVVAGDKNGSLRAFDRDGKPQWIQQLTPGGHHGGILGSPAFHAGALYICSGDFTTDNGDTTGQSGPSASSLFSIDGQTGSILWRAPIEGTCYGSISHANGIVYLPGGDGHLRAFDDRDGKLVWSAQLGISSAGGVTIADGMLFVSYGWSWSDLAPPGGLTAFGLP